MDLKPPARTFADFQNYSEEARSQAVRFLHFSHLERVLVATRLLDVSPDHNPTELEVEVANLCLSRRYMSMLQCWQDCNRNILLAKMTWSENYV